MIIPNILKKIKNVPNHQPDIRYSILYILYIYNKIYIRCYEVIHPFELHETTILYGKTYHNHGTFLIFGCLKKATFQQLQ